MNYIQTQDDLKDISNNAVLNYYHNPTAEVPMFLSLSELMRRKEMRDKAKANKPEEKTVAEDLIQAIQPQQAGLATLTKEQPMQQAMASQPEMPTQQMAQGGLVDLPINDTMFQEQNYAGGGIVAFDQGGSTMNKVRNYLLPPSPSTVRSLQGQSSNPFISGMQSPDSDPTVLLYKLKDLNNKPNKTLDDWNQISALEEQIKGGDQRGGYSPPAVVAGVADNNAPAVVPPAVPEKNPFDAYKPATMPVEKIESFSSYADEMKNYIGEDPMKQKLTDRLAKMESKATAQEAQAPWMALAQAGFGMAAGKSPFAMQNIAEGAGMGLKSYVEAKDKLTALEEKRFGLENDLARADRAEKIAVAKYGYESKQAAQARAQATALHNSSMATQVQIAKMNAAVTISNKLVTNQDRAVDNATKKADTIAKNNNVTTAAEYDAIYQPILQQEREALGLNSGSNISKTPSGKGKTDFNTGVYHP